MNVSELITALSRFPADLVVVHSTGMMQDREEVSHVQHGDSGQTAWTTGVEILPAGTWIEIV